MAVVDLMNLEDQVEKDFTDQPHLDRSRGRRRAPRSSQSHHVSTPARLREHSGVGCLSGTSAQRMGVRAPAIIARETTNHIYGISSACATERSKWAKEHAILVGDAEGVASQQSTAATE